MTLAETSAAGKEIPGRNFDPAQTRETMTDFERDSFAYSKSIVFFGGIPSKVGGENYSAHESGLILMPGGCCRGYTPMG